jgi:hypothetical protein
VNPSQELQQRLVHLYHASSCEQSNATPRQPCRTSSRCHELNILLTHVHQCEDDHCSVEDCVLTRCLLQHYRNCKDVQCLVCKPLNSIVERKKLRKTEVKFIHRRKVVSNQRGKDSTELFFHSSN